MNIDGEKKSVAKKYSDIIDKPHPTSRKHPRMSLEARAAQFAPFAALTGHAEELMEERRLTKEKIMQDEELREELDRVMEKVMTREDPVYVRCVYFVADEKKEGGDYVAVNGCFKRMDEANHMLVLKGGIEIPVDDIVEIEEVSEDSEYK